MNIRQSTINDINSILEIYEYARNFMKQNNNPNQWGDFWPPNDLIVEDILNNKSYVCVEDNQIAAVFFLEYGISDITYNNINGKWINNDKYAVIHRIASNKKIKGAGEFSIKWVIDKSKHVRIDTHKNNIPMRNLLKKLGFIECGIINIDDKLGLKDTERIAYEKI